MIIAHVVITAVRATTKIIVIIISITIIRITIIIVIIIIITKIVYKFILWNLSENNKSQLPHPYIIMTSA